MDVSFWKKDYVFVVSCRAEPTWVPLGLLMAQIYIIKIYHATIFLIRGEIFYKKPNMIVRAVPPKQTPTN